MRSLRFQLMVIVASLALLAVGGVTIIVALTTNQALEDTLDEQREAREVIVGELNELAFEIDDWDEADETVEELAEEYRARIALTDIDGFLLVDSGEGELPPLEGIVDPFGQLAEFSDDFLFDTETFSKELATCLNEESIEYGFDEFGDIFVLEESLDEEALDAVDDCFEEAVLIAENASGVPTEPALLFLSFDADPSIPWAAVALAAAGIILAAALVAAPLSSLVTRSLRRLSAAARAVRAGDLDVRVDADSPTEVADLAVSFNDMTAELAQAEARRKQLTADIAHELRSPLTNILGHLDAIEDGVIEPRPDQVRIISDEADRLAHLIDDLQTLAALDEHTLVLNAGPTDLCALIDRSLTAFRTRATAARIELTRSGECDRHVEVDPVRISQILGNLLDNALEHSPEDGQITVAIDDANDGVRISVADDGPGIPTDLLPRVFDRLSRADAARSPGRGGRGLGLAIARGLARAHGGDITARNQPGGGAVLEVTLPRTTGG